MAKSVEEKHQVLKEVFRHYQDYKDFVSRTGQDVIEYKGITICFSDLNLLEGLKSLSPQKRKAFYYNVLLDMKQRDVAAIMGIKTVTVGQYVEQAAIQLAKKYWVEHEDEKD